MSKITLSMNHDFCVGDTIKIDNSRNRYRITNLKGNSITIIHLKWHQNLFIALRYLPKAYFFKAIYLLTLPFARFSEHLEDRKNR